MREGRKDFEKLILEAVDEGLSVLGESGKHTIFFYLDKNHSIKRHEIPKKPETFVAGLERIFGAGTPVLEKLIVKSLCSKLGLKYEDEKDRSFADYVKVAKEESRCRSSSSNQESLEVKTFQQSSLPYLEMELKLS